MKIPFVDDFEIETKAGVKCSEKAVRYREEGNKLFQADKCTQVSTSVELVRYRVRY